jgi:hypothetical protein
MWSGITGMAQMDEAAGVLREVEHGIMRRGRFRPRYASNSGRVKQGPVFNM